MCRSAFLGLALAIGLSVGAAADTSAAGQVSAAQPARHKASLPDVLHGGTVEGCVASCQSRLSRCHEIGYMGRTWPRHSVVSSSALTSPPINAQPRTAAEWPKVLAFCLPPPDQRCQSLSSSASGRRTRLEVRSRRSGEGEMRDGVADARQALACSSTQPCFRNEPGVTRSGRNDNESVARRRPAVPGL